METVRTLMPPLRLLAALALMLPACSDEGGEKSEATWAQVTQTDGSALMSVHGTAPDDVWMVGADDGQGPVVLHFDGKTWERQSTGVRGDLWWVHAIEGGPVFLGGTESLLLRYEDGAFERLHPPGLGKHTVYGIFAVSPTDVYAVGSTAGKNGFIWHFDGTHFENVVLPDGLKEDAHRDLPGFFKVWGTSADDIWIVGGSGLILRGSADEGFRAVESGTDALLFTVHARDDRVVIVGGAGEGVLLEARGDAIVDRTPESAPLLQGTWIDESGTAWAVGMTGSVYRAKGERFEPVDPGFELPATHSLHATWADANGSVWAVGGNVLTPALDRGVGWHFGNAIEDHVIEVPTPPSPVCPEGAIDPTPTGSIARRWSEQILNAIRRDTPRPTVHARNLFHASIAMWDAWAAYDPVADGYLSDERLEAADVEGARSEAVSYAAYRVLSHRYSKAIGGGVSQACFDAFMQRLGYDPNDTTTSGDGARSLGNRIGFAVTEHFSDDGANEADDYTAEDGYDPSLPNLVVDLPGTKTTDPLKWQKLVLAKAETQNGIATTAGAQGYIGPQWGAVTPFALVRSDPNEAYLDIGSPPVTLDGELVDATVDVLRKSAMLDSADETLIDLSPGAMGNNTLGSNDGTGYPLNPVTKKPYAPRMVKRSDFGRVLAEFWADGPTSETPPGHWNTIANHASDHPEFARRLFGAGDEVDPLTWDVHVYLALNGAVHDAAIAAWELKRKYTSARPITLVRYMGGLGQRTDPNLTSYHPDGLPLVDDLIELITEESSAPGHRHAHLARYVGELAVRAWRGEPGDRKTEVAGCGWIRAVEWIPYQRRTFVTPAFPGYVSGHSTFSRASATVLATITGSEYFPGGYASYTFDPGYLFFERGPSAPVELGWATYFDAADQAGQSRIWGGIHVRHDDFDGRRIGARVGAAAIERAVAYFDGSARP